MDRKKPPGVSPEDQARLDAMGTDRVLKDLAQKYQPITPDHAKPPSDLSPEDKARLNVTGGLTALEHLKTTASICFRFRSGCARFLKRIAGI